MLPKRNVKFKQVQVRIVQGSQASQKLTGSTGLNSRIEAADPLGKEVSGGIKPLIPTPRWGVCVSGRGTCPLLSFHWGKEKHKASGT